MWSLWYYIYVILYHGSDIGPYFLNYIFSSDWIARDPRPIPCGDVIPGRSAVGRMRMCEFLVHYRHGGVGQQGQVLLKYGKEGSGKINSLQTDLWRTGGLVGSYIQGVVVSRFKAALSYVVCSHVSRSLPSVCSHAHLLVVIIPCPSSNLLLCGEARWPDLLGLKLRCWR